MDGNNFLQKNMNRISNSYLLLRIYMCTEKLLLILCEAYFDLKFIEERFFIVYSMKNILKGNRQ